MEELESHIFGEIRQIAFITADIDKAMDYWAKVLGIGSYFKSMQSIS